MPGRGPERWALAAAALAGIQVGAGIAGSRWLLSDIGPLSLALLRYAVALATPVPLLAWVGGTRGALARLNAGDAIRVMLLGIVQSMSMPAWGRCCSRPFR